jgi:hypothetical protein
VTAWLLMKKKYLAPAPREAGDLKAPTAAKVL